MKKMQNNKLEKISGGTIKCGTVGVLTGLASAAILISPVGAIGSLFGLSSNISDCWNS